MTLDLYLPPLVRKRGNPNLSLTEKFEEFHSDNPHVADALEALADQWFSAGNKKIGISPLYERIRWESGIQTNGFPYKLSNNHRAYYTRLLIERRPEWVGKITKKRLDAEIEDEEEVEPVVEAPVLQPGFDASGFCRACDPFGPDCRFHRQNPDVSKFEDR